MITEVTGYRFQCDKPDCDGRSPALRERIEDAILDETAHRNIVHERPLDPMCGFMWWSDVRRALVRCLHFTDHHPDRHENGPTWVYVGHEEMADKTRWLDR